MSNPRVGTAYERALESARALPGEVLDYPGVADTLGMLLDSVLALEGPAPYPIPEFSSEIRSALVKSPKAGRALCTAHTWTTGPWTCLLLDIPMPSLTRPRFVPGTDQTKARMVTDSKTNWGIQRIVAAIHALGLAENSMDQAVGFSRFGTHQSFVAWREPLPEEILNVSVKSDGDNLFKLAGDALQRAGIVRNDKGILRGIVSKEMDPGAWDAPSQDLLTSLVETARTRLTQGEDPEEVRVSCGLTKKTLRDLQKGLKAEGALPEEAATKPSVSKKIQRVANPTQDDLRAAVEEAKASKTSLAIVARKRGVKAADVQKEAYAMARQAILDHISPTAAAKIAQVKAGTLRKHFAKDPEVQAALAKQGLGLAGHGAKTALKSKATPKKKAPKKVKASSAKKKTPAGKTPSRIKPKPQKA